MDIRSNGKYPSNVLSNFHPFTFVYDQIICCSMEGFLQSLKFKNKDMQKEICTMVGLNAKKMGRSKKWWKTQTLYWKGKEIKRDSEEYQDLLNGAYQSLYNQCEGFRKALQSTGESKLTHSLGKRKINETILTKQEFCSRLTKLRDYGNIINI